MAALEKNGDRIILVTGVREKYAGIALEFNSWAGIMTVKADIVAGHGIPNGMVGVTACKATII